MKLIICLSALVTLTVGDNNDGKDLLAAANGQFTARMFSEVARSQPGKSVVLSAFSVLPPLAQLAVASEGQSQYEILTNIGLPNVSVTLQVLKNVANELQSARQVELKMASRIYITNIAQLNDQFTAVSRDVFGSDFKSVDFSKADVTAADINAWVEDHTNKRIKDLVQAKWLSTDTLAVLVNAIYFKGVWGDPFSKEATTDADFHISNDKVVKVPTMYSNEGYRYGEHAELNAKLLELPYVGGESSLLVILPNEVDGVSALIEELRSNGDLLVKARDNMFYNLVQVYLPKFKIETEIDLKEVLSAMGIKKLFTHEAHLNKLLKGTSDGVFVDKAIQKAFIEVNEDGTEAAAANAFIIAIESAIVSEPKTFKADHPFVFVLYAKEIPVFTGVYHN